VYFEVFGVHKMMGFLCNMMEDSKTYFGVQILALANSKGLTNKQQRL